MPQHGCSLHVFFWDAKVQASVITLHYTSLMVCARVGASTNPASNGMEPGQYCVKNISQREGDVNGRGNGHVTMSLSHVILLQGRQDGVSEESLPPPESTPSLTLKVTYFIFSLPGVFKKFTQTSNQQYNRFTTACLIQ